MSEPRWRVEFDRDAAKELRKLGEIDITIWGSTTEQLKTRAKTWPKHFDYVTGDYFGVATAGDQPQLNHPSR